MFISHRVGIINWKDHAPPTYSVPFRNSPSTIHDMMDLIQWFSCFPPNYPQDLGRMLIRKKFKVVGIENAPDAGEDHLNHLKSGRWTVVTISHLPASITFTRKEWHWSHFTYLPRSGFWCLTAAASANHVRQPVSWWNVTRTTSWVTGSATIDWASRDRAKPYILDTLFVLGSRQIVASRFQLWL